MDEVIDVQAQVRQFDGAQHAINADAQVDVLEEVQPVAQPLRRRQGQVRDQTGHHLQADGGRQDRRKRQVPQAQREVRQFGHAEEFDIRERQRKGRQRGEQRVQLGEVDRQVADIDVGQVEQIQVGQRRQAGQRQARELHAPLRPAVDQLAQACNAELGQFQREAWQAEVRQRRQAGERDRRELQLPVVPAGEQPPQRRQAEPEIRQAQVQAGHAQLQLPVEVGQRRQREARQLEQERQVRQRRQVGEGDRGEAQLQRRPQRDQLAQLRQRQLRQVQVQVRDAQRDAPVEVGQRRQREVGQTELQPGEGRQLELQARQIGHLEGGQVQAQAVQADAWQLEGEVEVVADVEQVEDAELGLHPDAEDVGVKVQHHLAARAADRDVPTAARELGEIREEAGHGVALGEGAVQAETDVTAFQRQEGVGAHQPGQIGGSLQRKELQPRNREAGGRGRAQQREREVQVVDGKADGVVVDRVVLVDHAVVVGVGAVGAIDADKGADVHAGDDQRIGRSHHLEAGHVEADAVQRALLEGETALQAHQPGHLRRGMADRGLDQRVGEIEPDRIGACAARGDVTPRHTTAIGEIDDVSGLAALVDADRHVVERELDEVAHPDETDLAALRLERRELRTHQPCQYVGRRLPHLVQAQAKGQLVDHQTDSVSVDSVAVVDDAVAVRVGAVRAVGADEGLKVAAADLEPVHGDVARERAARALDRQRAKLALGEGEAALHVQEVHDAQRGLVDGGAQHLCRHVQLHRLATGTKLVAGSAETADEVQRGPALDRGLVHHDVEPASRQLEVFGIEPVHRCGVGMGLQRRVVHATRLHLHQAKVNAFGTQAVKPPGLVGEGAAGVEPAVGVTDKDINVSAADGKPFGIRQRDAQRVLQPGEAALLETDRSAHIDEIRDAQQGLACEHAQARALEIQPYRRGPGGHVQAARPGEVQFPAGGARAVVLELHVRHRELEVLRIEAVDGHVPRTGLQRGVGRARRVLQAQQAEGQPVDAESVQAAGLLGQGLGAVDAVGGVTDEGRDATAADREALGAGNLRGSAASAQRVAVIGALEAKGTAEVDKARELQRGVPGVDAKTLAAIEIQRHPFCAAQF